jgi:2-polyprenyl-3-methyl-5-hydroxy-6-metoxy-1,4-benzoquinol methylase
MLANTWKTPFGQFLNCINEKKIIMTHVDISTVKQFYDEQVLRKLKGFMATNARVESAFAKIRDITPKAPIHVLEIGCGIGEVCGRMNKLWPTAAIHGFDVSGHSIELANSLFKCEAITFHLGEDVSDLLLAKNIKFDLVVMMDVYEHIPIASRQSLFGFLRERLSESGMLFISCPTPKNQEWLREHHPTEMQPVDETIYIGHLLDFSGAINRDLIRYEEVSIWHAGDYFHACFTADHRMQPVTIRKPKPTSGVLNALRLLKNELLLQLKLREKPPVAEYTIEEKKEMIMRKLDSSYVNQILS